MNPSFKFVAMGLCVCFFITFGCQSFNYGTKIATSQTIYSQGNNARSDFETLGDDDDKIGMWIFAGIAAAAAISAGVLLPLYLNDKL